MVEAVGRKRKGKPEDIAWQAPGRSGQARMALEAGQTFSPSVEPARMLPSDARVSGILLHPTSLPGPYGIGSLGRHARAFVDILQQSGQSLWQILPLGPTGYGDSPYAALDTFAGNPLLIDLDELVADGMVDAAELSNTPPSSNRVDYGAVTAHKLPLLYRVSERFAKRAPAERKREFEKFCDEQAWWLDDWGLFWGLKQTQGGKAFNEWEEGVRHREPAALQRASTELHEHLHACRVMQFYFYRQWDALRAYAHQHKVFIMGDMPIFVAYDSAVVWAQPRLFKIDQDLEPQVVAGVPPDYFSATGQLWGNPVYDWDYHAKTGFKWWIDRMRMALRTADIVRLDHFRGFEAAWEVPVGHTTARDGHWVEGPGDGFFDAIRNHFGGLPLVAEDLGLITKAVRELRDRHAIPGMHVLQFGFNPNEERIYAPHRCVRNSVVYTGTHDNDTTVGWFQNLSQPERDVVRGYLNTAGSSIHWAMIRAAYGTVANTVIVPMQDVLGLGSEARMNMPGQIGPWWAWRLTSEPHAAAMQHLRELATLYERLQPPEPEPATSRVQQ